MMVSTRLRITVGHVTDVAELITNYTSSCLTNQKAEVLTDSFSVLISTVAIRLT
jgi:hypothetical protein